LKAKFDLFALPTFAGNLVPAQVNFFFVLFRQLGLFPDLGLDVASGRSFDKVKELYHNKPTHSYMQPFGNSSPWKRCFPLKNWKNASKGFRIRGA